MDMKRALAAIAATALIGLASPEAMAAITKTGKVLTPEEAAAKAEAAHDARDYAEAARWWEWAADSGHVEAQYRMGNMFFFLEVTPEGRAAPGPVDHHDRRYRYNGLLAAIWYRRAAKQGHAGAQYALAGMAGGGHVPSDILRRAERIHWYRQAAEQGHAGAQYALGGLYFRGEGISRDYAEAARWWKKAAEQGKRWAQQRLGFMHLVGWGVTQDDAEAAYWLNLAAGQGDSRAQYLLGVMYYDGRGVPEDRAQAVRLWKAAADQGAEEAQAALGSMYYGGDGVPEDRAETVRLWGLAAERILRSGGSERRAKKDDIQGLIRAASRNRVLVDRWYRMAAEKGDSWAQYSLGVMHRTGMIGPRDDAKAVRWYRLAAEQGHPKAQTFLGTSYFYGSGVSKDLVQAWAWLSAGEEAGQLLNRTAEKMSPPQRAEAQDLAKDYWKRFVMPFREIRRQ